MHWPSARVAGRPGRASSPRCSPIAHVQETVTPNIDALVAEGVRMEQYYVHKYCSPTRSTIQSGRLPIHVNVLNADANVHNPADPVSGFAAVPRNMTGIASKLRQAGYATHMAGKWDV
jgi:arylsulfatase B